MRERVTVKRWVAIAGCVTASTIAATPAQAGGPANDDFADAAVIGRAGGDVLGRTFYATKEPGEPDHAGNAGGHSVWYRWVAPATGQFAFVTFGSDFDTVLGVYTGTAVDALTPVAASEDAGEGIETSAVSFRATAGSEYRLAIDGFGGKVGKTRLQWLKSAENDNFADAAALPAGFGRVHVNTVGTTWEPGERVVYDDADDEYETDGSTVWFRWTAPESGRVSFATERTDVDTVVAVYEGDALHELELVAANDDDPFFGCCASRATFVATAGRSYAIQVDSFDGWGESTLVSRRVLLGTRGGNSIRGTAVNEEIRGLAGGDRIRAGGGDDLVFAGDGADVVSGGSGDDVVYGGSGRDSISDLVGRDALVGGFGSDRLDTLDRAGGDRIEGGPGVDSCYADRGDRRSSCR